MIYVFVLFHILISKWSQTNLVRRCHKPNELTKLHTYFYKLANKYDVALIWKVLQQNKTNLVGKALSKGPGLITVQP